ncbi:C39 family peptidase [Laspinema olomoucense]|uniref:C39 family peptidase n=2 Tax=Laspinema TaxID=2584823 RepID=A0ABT2NE28_9CYAN|nr:MULTISPECIES: C39 family peptidase [unclassified Laspinema]MCT7980928.1 C39 family peptidase [Laspinema sp. D3b]
MTVTNDKPNSIFLEIDKICPLSEVASNQTLTTEIQQRLTELKLLTPPVDGVFGELTSAAYQRFQDLNGIQEEQEALGPKTIAALMNAQAQTFSTPRISLQTTTKTTFKTLPLQSSVLTANEQFSVEPGQSFTLANYERGHRGHYRITLQEAIRGNRVWYAFEEHVQLIEGNRTLTQPQQPAASVRLNVPFRSQMDNYYNPSGACNVTSIAMCLEYLGVPRYDNRYRQMEDELYRWCLDRGYSRHEPEDLARVVRDYKRKDDFTKWGTIERCQNHLRGGNPCVIHGYFTSFGHIIVLVGFDANGFIVHDPYGEWFPTGYRNDGKGAYLNYSYNLIRRTCIPDGQFWVHYISR